MSKMIKEMELVYNKAKKLADSNIDVEMLHYAKGVEICIEIAKKHKKKKKGKCEWVKDVENKRKYTSKHDSNYLYTTKFDYKYCPFCGKKIKVVDEDWMGYTE